jgi:hypothetical protein
MGYRMSQRRRDAWSCDSAGKSLSPPLPLFLPGVVTIDALARLGIEVATMQFPIETFNVHCTRP